MRKLFVSYARENKPEVDELVGHLSALGYQTWMDTPVPGGRAWWDGVIRRIAECDVFVVIISHHSLDSVTCRRELQWATALDKPVLPIAIEQLPDELPPGLATRQVIDYFEPGPGAACAAR